MGTKAVFAVETSPKMYCTTIIGMTMDGFPDNLKYIAHRFEFFMKKLRRRTLVKKGDVEAIQKILCAVVNETPGWLFIDKIDSACWVSHSAIYSPKKGQIRLFDGLLDYHTESVGIRKE